MAKILVNLPDAEREVAGRLVAILGANSAGTDYPDVPLTGTNKFLQVDLESSNTDDYPVTERAQVRVTAHAAEEQRTAVKLHVSAALKALCGWAGNANVAGIVPVSGRSAISVDPDTGNVMCWAIVRVDLKATTVAS